MLRPLGPPPPGRLLLPEAAAAALRLLPPLPAMEPLPKVLGGGALAKPRRPVIACSVCQIRFNSQSQAAAHYQGNRHARRLKGLEAARARRGGDSGDPPEPPTSTDTPERTGEQPPTPAAPGAPGPPSPPTVPPQGAEPAGGAQGGPGGEEEEEEKAKAKRLLYCALCKVAVNSLSQLEAHNKGTKHKTLVEARSGLGPIRAFPRPGGPAGTPPEPPERSFHCQICNVRLNSELQLKQHISSRRHRDGVAGKPNPLLSRHKKPRSPPELAPLPFPKELPKALAGGGSCRPPWPWRLPPPPWPPPHWPCAPPGPPPARAPPGPRAAAPRARAPAPRTCPPALLPILTPLATVAWQPSPGNRYPATRRVVPGKHHPATVAQQPVPGNGHPATPPPAQHSNCCQATEQGWLPGNHPRMVPWQQLPSNQPPMGTRGRSLEICPATASLWQWLPGNRPRPPSNGYLATPPTHNGSLVTHLTMVTWQQDRQRLPGNQEMMFTQQWYPALVAWQPGDDVYPPMVPGTGCLATMSSIPT